MYKHFLPSFFSPQKEKEKFKKIKIQFSKTCMCIVQSYFSKRNNLTYKLVYSKKKDFDKVLIRGHFFLEMLLARDKSPLGSSRDKKLWSEDSSKSGADTLFRGKSSAKPAQTVLNQQSQEQNFQDSDIEADYPGASLQKLHKLGQLQQKLISFQGIFNRRSTQK